MFADIAHFTKACIIIIIILLLLLLLLLFLPALRVMNLFSVKFVGLFVILLIGVSTVAELWQLLGDLDVPMVGRIVKPYESEIKHAINV